MPDAFFSEIRNVFSGDLLKEILALRCTPEEKSDGSYVTRGDILAQERIIAAAHAHLNEPVIISEELADLRPRVSSGAVLVIIDPIDGTENFTSGLPEWGVSICCYRDGKHIGSLIGTPEMGIWLQSGEQIDRFKSRIHGLSSSLNKEQIIAATSGYEYRILGCCVYNMINVIRGSFCTFENPKGACSWDILAGFNIALELGLHVEVEGKPYGGEYLDPERKYRFKIQNMS